MPPMGFVMLLLASLLVTRYRPRLGRRLSWVSLAGLLLLATPAVSYSMLLALESGLPTTPPPDAPPQAIVVLGGDVIRAFQEPLGVRPGLLSLDRERTAAAMHRRTGLPILVTGGPTQVGTPPVGLVMQQSLAEDFQTPPRWTESRSINTWQNARFSARILKAEGITSVYVVTHAWHMRRAVLAFKDTGLTVTAAPTDLDDPLGPDWTDFLPKTSAWQTCWFALHEWIGYAWYWLHQETNA